MSPPTSPDQLFDRFGKRFSKGELLFREGDGGTEMYVVRSGKVAISKAAPGGEKLLATLGPGEFFGELSILSGKPRTASATVAEDAALLVIDPKTFEAMIRGSAEIAVRLIKTLAARLADADAQIERHLVQDALARLIQFLARAAEQRGTPEGGGVRVEMPIADLPGELGLSPSQAKEAMRKVARAGLATFQLDGIVLPHANRLRELQQLLQE